MTLPESLYTAGLFFGTAAAPLVLRGNGKAALGLRRMRSALPHLERWAREHRDLRRKLVWLHAPSVGEGFQARAVAEAVKRSAPATQIVYTFFSPSAERFADSMPADVVGYLPPDLPGIARKAFNLIRPDALVFTKTEVWPNYTTQAARVGVPCALLSATLPARSSRLSLPARLLLGPAHRRLARVGAISAEDARRYQALGVPPERLFVMGDARFDQVAERAAKVDRSGDILQRLKDDRFTLVAGSTWREDDERLIPALADLLRRGAKVRMILVPHEPVPKALRAIAASLDQYGISHRLLGDLLQTDAREGTHPAVVVVDRTGILGDLYSLADVAYVGGGFGKAGLHSVLEPAAFGVPVLFGPHHRNAREAGELVRRRGARVVEDEQGVSERLRRWLEDEGARTDAGSVARRYVQENLGASESGAAAIMELIGI